MELDDPSDVSSECICLRACSVDYGAPYWSRCWVQMVIRCYWTGMRAHRLWWRCNGVSPNSRAPTLIKGEWDVIWSGGCRTHNSTSWPAPINDGYTAITPMSVYRRYVFDIRSAWRMQSCISSCLNSVLRMMNTRAMDILNAAGLQSDDGVVRHCWWNIWSL